MSAIRQIVDVFEPTMVIWLHGISDGNLKRELIAMGVDAMVHCLIGYGQPDRPTARENTVTELARLFGSNAINALVARDDSSYCGWSESYMNQWFRLQRYALHDVESIQLEFAYKTIRRSERLETSSRNIARTLAELIDFVPHATRRIGG
jgi:hypothetical protein